MSEINQTDLIPAAEKTVKEAEKAKTETAEKVNAEALKETKAEGKE